ncbi:type II toxin-antitoxin system VapC family toxin [Sulfurisoma sediminicola]|uniref:PIN domain nuclease of toxin-antitoxin system n=1 Tax=Sulfurisoma sediminicola TaxID=1381557 RepID=A0A497XCZ8_9PROT|nr:type II toxin-antitoxin system VapC family toxin [Sulfurisoma sediminicola]RLJ64569.1 PIN domain nuclease of toxin-antitoxin system [Sulfurisoma sediminicola]
MDILLDTHAFLRWVEDDTLLSAKARAAIEDRDNRVHLSAASAWELAIKRGIGKLKLALPVDRYVASHLEANGFSWLPIELQDIAVVESLPMHHRDPFDRLLVAQAKARKLAIVSADAAFSNYRVKRIW